MITQLWPLKRYTYVFYSNLYVMSFDVVNKENIVFFIISSLATLNCKIKLKTIKQVTTF